MLATLRSIARARHQRACASSAAAASGPEPLLIPLAPPNSGAGAPTDGAFAAAADVAARLRAAGHPAVIAGGWVRDRLLAELEREEEARERGGRNGAGGGGGGGDGGGAPDRRPRRPRLPPPADVDLAIAAPTRVVTRLFGHATDLPRGAVRLHHMGHAIEVARLGAGPEGRFFERSGQPADAAGADDDDDAGGAPLAAPPQRQQQRQRARHGAPLPLPYEAMRYSALHRDYTVNALFYDPLGGRVVDFVGGVADLRARTLRLVPDADGGGDAGRAGGRGNGGRAAGAAAATSAGDRPPDGARRLAEDPLRCLRGVRFAAQLGLALDPSTARAVRDHAELCGPDRGMPPRRVWLELRKLACGASAAASAGGGGGGGGGGGDEAGSGGEDAAARLAAAWPAAVRLMYHLGLLRALFPWLRSDADARRAALAAAALHAPAPAAAAAAAADDAGGAAPPPPPPARGVCLLPQELRVAALVNPAAGARGYDALGLYYASPSERAAVGTLSLAAELACGEGPPSSLAASGDPSGGALFNASSVEGEADDDDDEEVRRARLWARVYAAEHGEAALMSVGAWMPQELRGPFLRRHAARRALAERRGAVGEARQALARERRAAEASEAQAQDEEWRGARRAWRGA